MSTIAAAYKDYGRIAILISLSICLVGATLFSLTIGAVSIPLKEVILIFLKRLDLYSSLGSEPMHEVVFNSVRLPRICMTLLIGGSLGISGAAIIHDLNQAAQYTDKMYFLRDGKCTAAGPVDEVFIKHNIEEAFRCGVNVYYDSIGKCPFIIPQRWRDAKAILSPVAVASEV